MREVQVDERLRLPEKSVEVEAIVVSSPDPAQQEGVERAHLAEMGQEGVDRIGSEGIAAQIELVEVGELREERAWASGWAGEEMKIRILREREGSYLRWRSKEKVPRLSGRAA